MTSYKTITVSVRDGVCLLTLNRPQSGNPIDLTICIEWIQAMKAAAEDPAVKALIITGAGRFFSTGADVSNIAWVAQPGMAEGVVMNGTRHVTQAMIDFPKPTIAALNGPAVGYCAGLMGLFDTIYAAEGATLNTPFSVLGLVPEGLSSYTLPRAMGHSNAADMLVMGRKFTAEELAKVGFVSRVMPLEGFADAVVCDVAKALASAPMGSLLGATRLMRGSERAAMSAHHEKEVEAMIARMKTGEPAQRFAALGKMLQSKKAKL